MTTLVAVTLVIRGAIYTMDPSRPRAEVAVVQDGKFACVGSAKECPAPAGAQVIDLAGGSAVPGLTDAHGHVLSFGRLLESVDLRGCKDEAECVAPIAARAKERPPG